eukprot:7573252-Alexandrium_andersonii.AAC.1
MSGRPLSTGRPDSERTKTTAGFPTGKWEGRPRVDKAEVLEGLRGVSGQVSKPTGNVGLLDQPRGDDHVPAFACRRRGQRSRWSVVKE